MTRRLTLSSPGRLWRMSALRQALLLAGAFVVAAVIAGLIGLQIIANALTDDFDERLRALAETIGPESVSSAAPTHSDDEGDLVVGFLTADGRRTGPLSQRAFAELGARTEQGDEIGLDEEDDWRLIVLQAETGRLAIAAEFDSVNDTLSVVTSALATALALTVIAALITGLLIGSRAQRRLERMTTALDRFANGDLTARIAQQSIGSRNGDDLDHAALQIDQTLDRLQALVEQLRNLSANLAHQLKTPLARLRAMAETTAKTSDPTKSQERLGALVQETDAVIGIFNALLRIAQLDAGARRDRFVEVDLSTLAGEMAALYEPSIESGDRNLVSAIAEDVRVRGDRDLISQAIANLLENAIAHTPSGSSIGLSVSRPGTLTVWDDGLGVPPESRDRLLDPFYRVGDAGQGSGLGLAMVRAIADLHRAEITVTDNEIKEKSRPGFRIEIVFQTRQGRTA